MSLVDGTHEMDVMPSLLTDIRCNAPSASGCVPSKAIIEAVGYIPTSKYIAQDVPVILNAGPVRQLAVDVVRNVCRCAPRGRRRSVGSCPSADKEHIYIICLHTRSSACVPAVAGTHAPGRGEGLWGREDGQEISSVQLVLVVGVRVKDKAKWWKC